MNQPVTIAVVGSGYVGLVAAACFAEMGHSVICVDNDEAKVKVLRDGGVPIHEDYLPELLNRNRANKVEFTSDLRDATQRSQVIFIAVGTPQSKTGSADLSFVDAVASEIARSIDDYKVIVERAQFPSIPTNGFAASSSVTASPASSLTSLLIPNFCAKVQRS